MHDLNTINRLNLEAFADSINAHRKAGRFVLAKYEGLSLVSIETFSYQNQAQDAFDAAVPEQHGGSQVILFAPAGHSSRSLQSSPVPADQTLADATPSEDRKTPYDRGTARAAALREDKTLADYINRNRKLIGASDC